MIDRRRTGVESKLRKEQAGFRPVRGTTEQIFILRNIIEQSKSGSHHCIMFHIAQRRQVTGKLGIDDANFGQK